MDRVAFDAMLAQYATPEVSGNGRVSWDKGVRCVIPSVTLYGKCEQDGTPTPDAPVEIKCNNGVFALHGDTILDTTQLNTNDFGWISNADKEFSSTTAYYYFEIPAKPNTAYYCIAPYAVFGKSVGVTFICVDRVAKVINYIYHGTSESLCKTISTITTDETGVLYLLTTVPFNADNVLRSFWLTEYCGQAMAPELWAIPGTEYRDEWDCQTGWGVRRCKVIKDSGTGWNVYDSYNGFSKGLLPEALNFASGLCNQFTVLTMHGGTGARLGANNKNVYLEYNPYYDESLSDKGLSAWRSHLQEQPLTFVVPISSEPFYYPPARLTMPPGAGQIIQVGGDVADCPITARYLTHS